MKEKYIVFKHTEMFEASHSGKFEGPRDYVGKLFALHHNILITKFEELKYEYGKDKVKVVAHSGAYMRPK